MPKGETPTEWGARNAEQLVKSTKETLGKEMYFAIRLNLAASVLFALGMGLAVGFWEAWAWGLCAGTFVLFGVSLYWAWYIRRGLNRRWEKEMAAEKFATQKAKAEFRPTDGRLLGQNRTREIEVDGDGGVPREIQGPMRGWGSDS